MFRPAAVMSERRFSKVSCFPIHQALLHVSVYLGAQKAIYFSNMFGNIGNILEPKRQIGNIFEPRPSDVGSPRATNSLRRRSASSGRALPQPGPRLFLRCLGNQDNTGRSGMRQSRRTPKLDFGVFFCLPFTSTYLESS